MGRETMGKTKPVRVKPSETVTLGTARVTNKTATSIEVAVGKDGAVEVTNCCLEEQGK